MDSIQVGFALENRIIYLGIGKSIFGIKYLRYAIQEMLMGGCQQVYYIYQRKSGSRADTEIIRFTRGKNMDDLNQVEPEIYSNTDLSDLVQVEFDYDFE